MPATAPIDREVLLNLKLGDEHALERLFRTAYPHLADRARAELDDPASAPRVVEGAFLRAWDHRADFESPEALERFLQRSVHEGAVREKSRRASLHRFEQHEKVKPIHAGDRLAAPVADLPVDDAWQHLSAVLHAPPPDAAKVADAHHQHHKHEAAMHIASVAKRPPWAGPVIVAVVLAALFLVAMRWMDRTSGDVAVSRALASTEVRVRSTRPGERAALTLTDGSKATLAGDSKLRIPSAFGAPVRAVALEGAASFQVQGGGDAAFHVRTGEAMLTATGTAFDVRAFPGEARTLVRVREGTVTAKFGETTRALAAGDVVDLRPDGSAREVPAAARDVAFAWADGRLVLRDRPLREALVDINRFTGLTLLVPDASLLTRTVSADVELGSTRALLADLEKSGRLAFGYDGPRMVLRDAAAAGAAKK
ncbi:FecR domain-containing protein [Roseisolibacter sp. H3M3-2]|uniref:FecR domain-containing protein n=1 Tax=Roseisolibacter sp. H3M3-2 TaxID=3031323 RepID=UPI0023DCC7F5|nr:FecR domain-containing protein [Roseisolibacter sp. H3M3-2]MDF1503671.1 FecR domain-containing protein [Roseisolibacter sp. H3M3-2]